MRLIDADALMNDINTSINEMTKIGIGVDGDWLWAKLNDAIENAQIIEERKTGKWEERQVTNDKCVEEWQSARCSVCGKYHTTPYLYFFNHYSFCPHCGSRMEDVNDSVSSCQKHSFDGGGA